LTFVPKRQIFWSPDNCQNNGHKFQKHDSSWRVPENSSKPWFCIFWTQFDSFDVGDSCHVVLDNYLARRSRDNCQEIVKTRLVSKSFSSGRMYANLDSFDRYHVVLKDSLARQSRDNCHKSRKHVLIKLNSRYGPKNSHRRVKRFTPVCFSAP